MINKPFQQYEHTKETVPPFNQKRYGSFLAEIRLRYLEEPDPEFHEITEDVIYEFLVG